MKQIGEWEWERMKEGKLGDGDILIKKSTKTHPQHYCTSSLLGMSTFGFFVNKHFGFFVT